MSARDRLTRRWNAPPPERPRVTGSSRLARALSRRWPKSPEHGDTMLANAMAAAASEDHPERDRALVVLLREIYR